MNDRLQFACAISHAAAPFTIDRNQRSRSPEYALFLFDKEWNVIDMISAAFADQTDKFIFWRQVGDRATSLKAVGASWTAESWIRSTDKSDRRAIRHLPIVGERLANIVFDQTGEARDAVWEVKRESATAKPELQRLEDLSELEGAKAYYLVPLRRAMGLSAIAPGVM